MATIYITEGGTGRWNGYVRINDKFVSIGGGHVPMEVKGAARVAVQLRQALRAIDGEPYRQLGGGGLHTVEVAQADYDRLLAALDAKRKRSDTHEEKRRQAVVDSDAGRVLVAAGWEYVGIDDAGMGKFDVFRHAAGFDALIEQRFDPGVEFRVRLGAGDYSLSPLAEVSHHPSLLVAWAADPAAMALKIEPTWNNGLTRWLENRKG